MTVQDEHRQRCSAKHWTSLHGIKKHDYFFAAAAPLIRAVQLVNPSRLGFTVSAGSPAAPSLLDFSPPVADCCAPLLVAFPGVARFELLLSSSCYRLALVFLGFGF